MAGNKSDAAKVERSNIAFPYVDLDGAIEVAKAMWDKGGVPLERDQLAAAMDLTANSGNFSIRIGSARQFGLIENSQGKNQLTPLGFDILDPSRAAGAKVKAFLEVPLYRRVYDEYRGKQLPPRPHGLESAFVNFGVAPKQKDKARHVFDRSARSAGFFPNPNEDRLVAPAGGFTPDPESSADNKSPPSANPVSSVVPQAATQPTGKRHHPFIEGLLERLPPIDQEWPSDRRAKWLEAASNIFDLLYGADGGTVRVTVESAKH